MLRSVNRLVGYTLGARDGEIGSVDSFVFDDPAPGRTRRSCTTSTAVPRTGREGEDS